MRSQCATEHLAVTFSQHVKAVEVTGAVNAHSSAFVSFILLSML